MKSKGHASRTTKSDVSRTPTEGKCSDYTGATRRRWTVNAVLALMRTLYPSGPVRRYTVEVQARTGASWSTITAASKVFQREHLPATDNADETARLRSRVLELEELLATADERAESRFLGDRAFLMRSIATLKTELEMLRASTGRALPVQVITPEEPEPIFERNRK